MAILREIPIKTYEQFENTLQSVENNENSLVQSKFNASKLSLKNCDSATKEFCWQENNHYYYCQHSHNKETIIGCNLKVIKRNRSDQGHCDSNFVVWNVGWPMFRK